MDRGLRRQWEQALRRIPMPEPFEAVAFCELLGPHLGRELVLVPKASTGGPCGMVARTDTTDFIFYETATSPGLSVAVRVEDRLAEPAGLGLGGPRSRRKRPA